MGAGGQMIDCREEVEREGFERVVNLEENLLADVDLVSEEGCRWPYLLLAD